MVKLTKSNSKKKLTNGGLATLMLASAVVPTIAVPVPTVKAAPNAETDFTYTTTAEGVTITGYVGTTKDVVIPNTINGQPVINIGNDAFRSKALTSVVLPDTLQSIGTWAFALNTLTAINIPEGVTSLGDSAFRGNTLTTVTIPTSLTVIGTYAFSYNSISEINIPSSIVTIGNFAFYKNKLTSLTVPSSVTTIGSSAFGDNLISNLTLNEGLTTISYQAFIRNKLTHVTLPSTLTELRDTAFSQNSLIDVTVLSTNVTYGTDVFKDNPTLGATPSALLVIAPEYSTSHSYALGKGHSYQKLVQAPPNTAPQKVGVIPNTEVASGQTSVVDVSTYFTDNENDALTYQATVSDINATVTVDGSNINFSSGVTGTYTVTVKANDGSLDSEPSTFTVTVTEANTAPTVVSTPTGQISVALNTTSQVNLNTYFQDVDGDTLTYEVQTSDPSVTAEVTNGVLNFTSSVGGNQWVKVKAYDGALYSEEITFNYVVGDSVAVKNLQPGTIITLRYGTFILLDPSTGYMMKTVNDGFSASANFVDAKLYGSLTAEEKAQLNKISWGVGKLESHEGGTYTNQPTLTLEEMRAKEQSVIIEGYTGALTVSEWRKYSKKFNPETGILDDPTGYKMRLMTSNTSGQVWIVYPSNDFSKGQLDLGTASSTSNRIFTTMALKPETLLLRDTFVEPTPVYAPVTVTSTVPDKTVQLGASTQIDVSTMVTGDVESYSVSTDNAFSTANIDVNGLLTVSGVSEGTTVVTVTVTGKDGNSVQLTFNVTAEKPNSAPTVTTQISNVKTEPNVAGQIDLTPYFSDTEGDVLTYSVTTDAPTGEVVVTGNTLSYNLTQEGVYTVTVKANDGEVDSAPVTFTLTSEIPNAQPTVTQPTQPSEVGLNTSYQINLADYFSDTNGDVLVYNTDFTDTNAQVVIQDGKLNFTPTAPGTYTVTVVANDGEVDSAPVTFTFEVVKPNSAPTGIQPTESIQVNLNATDQVNLANYFTDSEGDLLTYTVNFSNPNATAEVQDGLLHFTPTAVGEYTVEVTANDGKLNSTPITFTFNVVKPNTAPTVITVIGNKTINTGEQVQVDLSTHFTDAENDVITYEVSSNDLVNSTATLEGNNLVFTSTKEGTYTVTVRATDGSLQAQDLTFTVTVVKPNTAPEIVKQITDITSEPNQAVQVNLPEFFTDVDGDTLTYQVTTSDEDNSSVSVNSQKQLVFRGFVDGVYTVTARATDGKDYSETITFTVTVETSQVEPEPVVPTITTNLVEGSTYKGSITPVFIVENADSTTYTLNGQAYDGVSSISTVGTHTIVVKANYGDKTLTKMYTFTVEALEQEPPVEPTKPTLNVSSTMPIFVNKDQTDEINLAPLFSSESPETLEYEIINQTGKSYVTATLNTSTLSVLGVSSGESTIQVRAKDEHGTSPILTVVVKVYAEVKPHVTPPSSETNITSMTIIGLEEVRTIALNSLLSTLDPETTTVDVTNSKGEVVAYNLDLENKSLDITSKAKGFTNLQLKATDSLGNTSTLQLLIDVHEVANFGVNSINNAEIKAKEEAYIVPLNQVFGTVVKSNEATNYVVGVVKKSQPKMAVQTFGKRMMVAFQSLTGQPTFNLMKVAENTGIEVPAGVSNAVLYDDGDLVVQIVDHMLIASGSSAGDYEITVQAQNESGYASPIVPFSLTVVADSIEPPTDPGDGDVSGDGSGDDTDGETGQSPSKELESKLKDIIVEIEESEKGLILEVTNEEKINSDVTLTLTEEGIEVTSEGVTVLLDTKVSIKDFTNKRAVRIGKKDLGTVPQFNRGKELVITSKNLDNILITDRITEPFVDVKDTDYFKPEVEDMYNYIITVGTTATTYDPSKAITRGQFAKMLARALELDTTSPVKFKDIQGQWYAQDVQALYEAGIVAGYSNGNFGGQDTLTREQASAIIVRALEYLGVDTTLEQEIDFKDEHKIAEYAKKDVHFLASKGFLVNGIDTNFNPKNSLTRGQMAQILMNALRLTDLY